LINNLLNSLHMGSIYALIALAFGLISSVTGIINFINGMLYIIGIYIIAFGNNKILFLVCFLSALVICSGLNILFDIVFYKKSNLEIYNLIISVILFFLVQNIFILIFDNRSMSLTHEIYGAFKLGNLNFEYGDIISCLLVLIIGILFYWFLNKTKLGHMIRAVSENSEATVLMGMNNRQIIYLVYFIATFFIICASSLYVINFSVVKPDMSTMVVLRALAGAVIAGAELNMSLKANFVLKVMSGGFMIAIIERLAKDYVSTKISDIFIFGIMSVCLYVRHKNKNSR